MENERKMFPSQKSETGETEEIQVIFYEMRLRCYQRLADITDELLELNDSVQRSRNLRDEDLYFKRIQIRIKILGEVRSTLQGMLRESVYDSRLEEVLDRMEKRLESATVEELAEAKK